MKTVLVVAPDLKTFKAHTKDRVTADRKFVWIHASANVNGFRADAGRVIVECGQGWHEMPNAVEVCERLRTAGFKIDNPEISS